MPARVSLRPAVGGDSGFLAALFGAAHPEFDLLPLAAEQRDALVALQWRAKQASYLDAYPAASDLVIECSGQRAGRLLVDAGPPMTVVDIAVVPSFQGTGVATEALRMLLRDADDRGVDIRLHVAVGNPARRLYERLGFAVVEPGTTDVLLVRPAGGAG
jgi:ribosomal protein S18 acetylase RimI-like enzyme